MDEKSFNLPVNVYLRDKSIDSIRQAEFSRLKGLVYLDHAGSTLYPESLLTSYQEDLASHVYGNPHGASESSILTTDTVEQTRVRILQHFHVTPDDYSIIFTSGCTHALRIVAENFDFNGTTCCQKSKETVLPADGCFSYLEDNHTSVLGLREIAKSRNVRVLCVPVQHEKGRFREPWTDPECFKDIFSLDTDSRRKSNTVNTGNCLFAFPAQSNFSGTKYPLAWVKKLQGSGGSFSRAVGCDNTYVLLDAAALVSTSDLDLRSSRPDFVTLSFYKMFGFPTGLGALLVRNDSVNLLQKTYFGGGTVHIAIATEDYHVKNKNVTERFEDGTIPFLDVIALKHGFEALHRIAGGMPDIRDHTHHLACYIHHCLRSLRHRNGQPVVKLYCETDFEDVDTQGPIINFNVLNPDGEYIGYTEVEKLATVYNIQFRVGCFCNLGTCHRLLGIPAEQAKAHYKAGHICGDDIDLIDGQPTGSVRASLGYMTTLEDAQRLLDFIGQCFVDCFSSGKIQDLQTETPLGRATSQSKCDREASGGSHLIARMKSCDRDEDISKKTQRVTLTHIFIYPIKSCAAVQVRRCELGPRGLQYDREWMVVTETGNCLNQKREPLMCRIQPKLDVERGHLLLQYPGMEDFAVPLSQNSSEAETLANLCDSRVCADRIRGLDCGDDVSEWLQRALDRPGLRLIRQVDTGSLRKSKRDKLSLANEAQYLLINAASVAFLSQKLREHTTDDNPFANAKKLLTQFRANLVVSTSEPYKEETWTQINIGKQTFKIERRCQRCQMICVDQESGERSKDPLMSLLTSRNRRATFGVLLHHVPEADESSSGHEEENSSGLITQGEEICVTTQI